MAATGADALITLYRALVPEEQDAAYERLTEIRLSQQQATETQLAKSLRSLRRVAEVLGRAPYVDDYRAISQQLRADGEDVEPFSRVYRTFDSSWSRAREALAWSGQTNARAIEARFQARRIGRIQRYPEDVLRETLAGATRHYGRPPSTAEFAWWRDRQIELARDAGEEHPNVPTDAPYRRRWKTWEAALLHFGYTTEQVALRWEQRTQVYNPNFDTFLPDDLPVAVLGDAAQEPDGLLSREEAQRVRACYEAMPQRTQYVLTTRLGLGTAPQGVREVAEPLALHFSSVRKLQAYAQDALLQAANEGRKNYRVGLRADITAWLQAMSHCASP